MVKIAPSVLAADFSCLGNEVLKAVNGGCEYIHLDIMDGFFVPEITFGAGVVKALRPVTDVVFDVHLMIEHPETQIASFAEAGADIINFHIETVRHPHRILQMIKSLNCKCAVTLNPGTPLSVLDELLPYLDMVLLMTVNPGFGGQEFIETMLDKINRLKHIISQRQLPTLIEVDGGINEVTARQAVQAGADILVAGSAVYGSDDIKAAIKRLRS